MKAVASLGALALLVLPSRALAQPTEPEAEAPAPEGAAPPAPPPASTLPAPAAAPAPPLALEPDTPVAPSGPRAAGAPRVDFVRVNAGLKMGYVPARAFDVYASNDALPQLSIDGTYTLLTSGKLALAAGVGWDVGGRSSGARGFDTSLTQHRLYVPVEGRFHLARWLYAFGKVAPGAAAVRVSAKDPSAPDGEISGTGWAFATDASAGASFLLGPRKALDERALRFWITPEAGWAFMTKASPSPDPGRDSDDVLGSDEPTNLGRISLGGFFWRATLGATF